MGIEEVGEMKFWSKEEYLTFSRAMMNKEESYHAFEILYCCGIRLGELLALTAEDFDFEKKTLRINKSYQRIKGKDVITTPKTRKSNRVLTLPDFLAEEMQDYISRLPYLKVDDRIFTITKSGLHHEIDRGCRETGVKRIRVHDLRHPYVKPKTKKYGIIFEVFGQRNCCPWLLHRCSWLMPPFPVLLFQENPALHIRSRSCLLERDRFS